LATWAEVRSYIASKYIIANDSGNLLTINFQTEGGRSQVVFVSGDDDLIMFKSPFAKEGQVQPGKVIQMATVFGVVQVGDMYCVTHVQLTQTLDTPEIDVPLNLMAANADEIEKNLGLANNF
jgi:hypothetical protein